MIPYGRQDVTQADLDAVAAVLRSDFLTQGPAVPAFEKAVASRVQAQHGVAVNSATAALHVACLALGLGPGDRLWTVPNTFVASANCALYCGATVDFVDINAASCNMSVTALRARLEQARRDGKLPKVVVPVHFAGQPTDQEAIWALAQEYGFKVIEDASHAVGASGNGEPAGSCRWSDIAVFSFHPVKIITTAEGGLALTNDRELARKMEMFRSHGITRDPALFEHATDTDDASLSESRGAPWYYEQQMLGYNYRMTDMQAALGLSQLERLDRYVERRNELATRYGEALRNLPVHLPQVAAENRSAFHLYVIRLKRELLAKTHRQIFEELRGRGVGVNVHYMPVHLQPYYRRLGFTRGQFPHAEAHGDEAISLPLYPTMSLDAQDTVIGALKEVLR